MGGLRFAFDEEAARRIAVTRSLHVPAEHGNGFHRRYYEAFQPDPGTVLARSETRKVPSTLA